MIGYDIITLHIRSFYTKICGYMKYVLSVRACSMSKRIIARHGTILMLYANVHIKYASARMFGLVMWQTLRGL